MSIPLHVVPRQSGDKRAENDRAVQAKQLLLARYLDPWGTADIVWCHSHTLVRGYKVILNVYNLFPSRLNGCLSILRLGGAFHSGIQVGDTEYAFGGHSNDDLGITALKTPLFLLREDAEMVVRQGEDEDGSAAANLAWMPTLRSRSVIGWWMGPLSHLEAPLRELRFNESWIGSEYRLLSRNCNHFALAMCAALLQNPKFKPAPGCSRPEDMVPRTITRLPALALALGSCAPFVLRRLNAPMPLAPQALNAFHGQGRKPDESDDPRSRSAISNRVRTAAGDASSALRIRTRAADGAAVGVQLSSVPAASMLCGDSALSGCTVDWRTDSAPPRAGAASAAATTTAAAAAEGRLLRPRIEGRYQSLRVETAQRPSIDLPSRSSCRHRTEDGEGGTDTPVDAGTTCSTPDLAATAAAATKAASVTAATATGNVSSATTYPSPAANGKMLSTGQQWPQAELSPGSPLTPGSAAPPYGTPTFVNAAGGPFDVSPTTSSATCTCTGAPTAAQISGHTTACAAALSLPPVLVMDAGGSAASTPATMPACGSTCASSSASATPPRSSGGSRFVNPSRSGRRVFPDPWTPPPVGPEGGGGGADGTHDYITAISGDGGPPHLRSPDSASLRKHSRGDLEEDVGVSQRLLSTGTAGATGANSQSSRPRHPFLSPRSSSNGLPPLLQPRLDGSATKLTLQTPLPTPLAQLPLQQQQQQQHYHHPPLTTPHIRSAGVTTDGSASAATATSTAATLAAAKQRSSSDLPRPWSVLSGGFVDLLFTPPEMEPPPGVPNAMGISGRLTSPGIHPGDGGGGGGSGHPGAINSRRYASFTGDGGAIFSAASNATLGGLATVNSGDLSDEGQEDLHEMAARARASTSMLAAGTGIRVEGAASGGAGSGGGGGGGLAAGMIVSSGLGAAALAAASPLRPSGPVSRANSKSPVLGHGGLTAAAVAAVAVVADGSTPPTLAASRRPH